MKLKKYRVIREHLGDRWYPEGDERTLAEADAKNLVPHVLELIGDADEPEEAPAEKAEPEHQNKAEPAAPANKAEPKGRKPASGA